MWENKLLHKSGEYTSSWFIMSKHTPLPPPFPLQ